MFEFHELMTNPGIWMLFFGYGLIASTVIDFIDKLIPNYSSSKQIVLYILFGYLIFLVLMPVEYLIIAGTVGAFFSLLFLFGKEKLKHTKWYNWITVVIPLVCVMMLPIDFTSKEGWKEVVTEGSVEVEYDYFNGEHLIPIHGEQGEQIFFEVEHHLDHGHSHGMSFYDENGNHEGMNEINDDVSSVEFEKTTTKYLVVRAINGNHGKFQAKWWRN